MTQTEDGHVDCRRTRRATVNSCHSDGSHPVYLRSRADDLRSRADGLPVCGTSLRICAEVLRRAVTGHFAAFSCACARMNPPVEADPARAVVTVIGFAPEGSRGGQRVDTPPLRRLLHLSPSILQGIMAAGHASRYKTGLRSEPNRSGT